jgi:hypothetical protein
VAEVQRLGVPRAQEEAHRLVARAMGHIALFADKPAYQVMRDISQFVLQREN